MSQRIPPRGEIAIIGMACMFPGAPNLRTYWNNIIHKIDAITDPPPEAWDADTFYDPSSSADDRVYCKRGGYLGPLAEFNPLDYGIMPLGLEGGEPDQWLTLKVARDALADANYLDRLQNNPEERHRTAVILGKGTYLNRGNLNMVQQSLVVEQTLQVLQTLHPEYSPDELSLIRDELKSKLPAFNAETAPGLVPNIVASRIANRLDLMGPTYTIDAACASSLIAVDIATRDLLTGQCDLALVGGVQITTPIPILTLFSHLNALSRRQEIRPFDLDADGTLLSEGLGIVVLKRAEDAQRDGDRIYAVIKGVGTSSDGKGLGVLAPRLEGAVLAMRRAYENAGVSPITIGLIEAHGTGTSAGDLSEMTALKQVFGKRDGHYAYCAVGSVKSMIGHTMPAAGIAGLIKVALALHHKVLPPTLNCDEPNPKFDLPSAPFYINTETRPWIHPVRKSIPENGTGEAPDKHPSSYTQHPRRAGVNAFGFGGINAHVILEEFSDGLEASTPALLSDWDSEVIVIEAETRQLLIERVQILQKFLETRPETSLLDLAYTVNNALEGKPSRLSMVATSVIDLQTKLSTALKRLNEPARNQIKDRSGIYYFDQPFYPEGLLALLFPGEGSQYPNMLADMYMHFPEVRAVFDFMDSLFKEHPRGYLPSDYIFTRPQPKSSHPSEETIWQTDVSVEAVLTANRALWTLLTHLGIRPDVLVGHSTGEYSALYAAGMIPLSEEAYLVEHLMTLNHIYQDQLSQNKDVPRAVLIAIGAGLDKITPLLENHTGKIFVGMDNCPHQTVIAVELTTSPAFTAQLRAQGLIFEILPFDRAYHTPLFAPYSQSQRHFFEHLPVQASRTPLYSCTTTTRFPNDPATIRKVAMQHWTDTVRFRETILRMYEDGVRIFVEVGANSNLTGFVDDTLRSHPHVAIPSNSPHQTGLIQLHHLLAMLNAQGIPMDLNYLYQRRTPQRLDLANNTRPTQKAGTLKLPTGWAGMSIRPEIAAQLRQKHEKDRQVTAPDQPPSHETSSPHTNGLGTHPTRVTAPPAQTAPGTLPPTNPLTSQGSRTQAIQVHLQLMQQFLDTQQTVMGQFLEKQKRPGFTPPPASPPLPFIRAIESLLPGQELIATCTLDLAKDVFLKDHTFGRAISTTDPTLPALPVVPLTFSMEILAEAAATLLPAQKLVRMKNIRANRWILLENDTIQLRVIARHSTTTEIHVTLSEADDQTPGKLPILEGIIEFGSTYSSPPKPLSSPTERPSRWTQETQYTQGMFHGPLLQAVASMEETGQDSTLGVLESLPVDRLIIGNPSPTFVAEPVVLDAAGQVIGLWAMEELAQAFIIFPFRLEMLDFYGPPLQTSERVSCRGQVSRLGDDRLRSDIDILDSGKQVRMRLTGWEDKRFDVPRPYYEFLLNPLQAFLGKSWGDPLQGNPGQCFRVVLTNEFLMAHGELWQKVLAHLVLSRKERETWRTLQHGNFRRRLDWLRGRVAAKDAVRSLVKSRHNLDLCPADVEIIADEEGRPSVQGSWMKQVHEPIQVSLAHSHEMAIAIAQFGNLSLNGQGIGIDVEWLGHDHQAHLILSDAEQELLSNIKTLPEDGWLLRLWCAKEAVGKSFGVGLAGSMEQIIVNDFNPQTSMVQIKLTGKMLEKFPHNGLSIVVYTQKDGDYVVASAGIR